MRELPYQFARSPGIIRRNAAPQKSVLIHLTDFRSIWIYDHAKRRSRHSSISPNVRGKVAGRDLTVFYQVGSQRVKHKISRNSTRVLIEPRHHATGWIEARRVGLCRCSYFTVA